MILSRRKPTPISLPPAVCMFLMNLLHLEDWCKMPGAPPSVLEGGDFSSQFPIDNPVTTLLHYSRKEVRLAFRETPLTTQI